MVGKTISHYRILEEVGKGGMGVVYKAEDTKLRRVVALKFLPQHLNLNDTEQARFLQEAQAAATMNHPNVCTVYDIIDESGQQCIVMEYIDGTTLKERMPAKSVQEALAYAVQIGDALKEAHAKGIVHRDIKSENIMVDRKNQIKVMDFGLAKLRGAMKLTRTSSTVGTLGYMAPEQLQGGEVDTRSDIFSFGVVLYELLTGRMPFHGEHEAAIMYSIVNEEPRALQSLRTEISPELERIVRRALEKDPEDRYQHVDDMVSELRRLQKQTTRVVRPDQPQPASREERAKPARAPVRWKKPLWLGLAAAVLVAAALWYFLPGRSDQTITSMAVLPFVNTGGDPSNEYLSDGFTEGLINSLSRLPGMKMMSSSSVFRYKGKEIDPRAVGNELHVGAVLLGKILQNNDALTVSVELVDTKDNSHLWGEQYTRSLSDLASLQGIITRDLSNQLNIALSGEQQHLITQRMTENSEAYQLYLKGRFYWFKRTREGLTKAVDYFNQAIEKDPSFARAYAGLADSYVVMGGYSFMPPKESEEKSRAAARRALEIDDRLAEAHTTLAVLYENYDWDWKNSEREYLRALELDPNYATARQWYGEFLGSTGRPEAALAELQKSIELDPLVPIHYLSTYTVLLPLHRYKDAVQFVQKALEIDPNFPRAHSALGWIYNATGKQEDAVRETGIAIVNSDSSAEYLAELGYILGRMGKRTEASSVLDLLQRKARREYVDPYLLGSVYVGLGNNDEAFQHFTHAVDVHSTYMEYLNVDPVFEPVRGDPRFKALVKRVGLPGGQDGG